MKLGFLLVEPLYDAGETLSPLEQTRLRDNPDQMSHGWYLPCG